MQNSWRQSKCTTYVVATAAVAVANQTVKPPEYGSCEWWWAITRVRESQKWCARLCVLSNFQRKMTALWCFQLLHRVHLVYSTILELISCVERCARVDRGRVHCGIPHFAIVATWYVRMRVWQKTELKLALLYPPPLSPSLSYSLFIGYDAVCMNRWWTWQPLNLCKEIFSQRCQLCYVAQINKLPSMQHTIHSEDNERIFDGQTESDKRQNRRK